MTKSIQCPSTSMASGRHRSRLGRSILMAMLGGAVVFCNGGRLITAAQEAESPPLAKELTTASVSEQPDSLFLNLEGVVEAVNQATMTAQIAGQIIAVYFDVNDRVEKDQVLMRIKGKKQEAGLNSAKASLSEANAVYVQAEGEYKRIRQMFAKKMVTAAQMDQAQAAFDAAKAKRSAATAHVDSASETVADSVIHAPFSGYVLQRFVQLGETTHVGQALFSGMAMDPLRVLVKVPQQAINAIRSRQQAQIMTADGVPIPAEKITIFPYANEQSHAFGVRLALPANPPGLFPGMLVKVVFNVADSQHRVIPDTAILYRSELTGVYVVKGRVVQFRRVLLGHPQRDHQVEILAGLEVGEKVALDPVLAGRVRSQPLPRPTP